MTDTATPAPLEGIIVTPGEGSGALVTVNRPDPIVIFTNPALGALLLERITAEAKAFTPDLTTAAGRKEIAARARQVASTKTYLDKVGKEVAAELKDLPKQVDAGRKVLWNGLEALQAEIRKDLDALEAREEETKARIRAIQDLPTTLAGACAAQLQSQIVALELTSTDPATFGDFAGVATAAVASTVAALQGMIEKALKAEAEAAELARLREESARRAQQDREEQIRREAEEKARKDAEAAAQAERDAAARREAQAKLEAQQAEQRAKDAEARAEQERKDAERKAQEAAEAATAAERRRAEQERQEQETKARIEREAAEKAAADVEHRRTFNREALADILQVLVDAGAESDDPYDPPAMRDITAKAILTAIVTGKIRHIAITY